MLPFGSLHFPCHQNRLTLSLSLADDHATKAVGCYGGINETPNLDRLAAEGMRFDRSFCTNGICAPARAVILTGKHSHLNGQLDNRQTFDGSQQTFPKLLQQAGLPDSPDREMAPQECSYRI